jgi:hypothetical protein
MEKYIAAAINAWNPIGEVRRRQFERTLRVPDVLPSSVAAIITCNLFWFTGWNFFWNAILQNSDQALPELKTSQFVVQLASMVGVVVPVGALLLLPSSIFQPVGRSAVAAAIVLLIAAQAFYSSAFGAIVFFIGGAVAFDDAMQGLQTFMVLNGVIGFLQAGLLLFFWVRIARIELRLPPANILGISFASVAAVALLAGLLVSAAA